MKLSLLSVALLFSLSLMAQDAINYQIPPKDIYNLAMAKPSPVVSINYKGDWMLIMERSAMPGVEELAQPELRIAGMRINPNNFGPSRMAYTTGLKLKNMASGIETTISGLPAKLKASNFQWSPGDNKIAFLQTEYNAINLYVIDIVSKKASKINKLPVNASMGSAYTWYDNHSIVYLAATKPYTSAPKKELAPKGPVVQQSLGKTAASVTFQDLIKNPYDEALFEFYCTSQMIKNTNGVEKKIGQPMIYRNYDFSPDNRFLLVDRIDKPFSYLVPASGFNHTIFIADLAGNQVSLIDKLPSRELAPTGYDNVQNIPRNHNWVSSLPATLSWIEPLDSGLIKKQSDYRDQLYFLHAPFHKKEAIAMVKTKMRMGSANAVNLNEFIINEYSRVKHKQRVSWYDANSKDLRELYDISTDDAYNDPGDPIYIRNEYGRYVPKLIGSSKLVMTGSGASPDGDMPFLRTFDISTKEKIEIWRCKAPYFEAVTKVLDFDKMSFITSKQSQNEQPNYFLHTNGVSKKITDFPDPQPQLRGVTKQKITYKRKDGIDLAADLYLPKDYDKDKDGRLPVIMWAYPREFKSSSDAAQIRGSKYTFVRSGYGTMLFWVTQGYAIMDNTEFPIVGEGDKQPNDNFIDQLVWNAEAAINKIHEMGIGDTARVAVGGHSYGAFMTANLLGHTHLFKAGVARSGAYNRTLTPFGFQNEERTYWQAPEIYYKMSPFSVADKIKTPMLMIHGEADNNPGTFPIQSERLYNAIKGHGGTVRFVLLPYESHGYAAKENILHLLWEQDQWFKKYLGTSCKL